ncbi:MAG: hypothetical protein IRY99_19060 [Isosphaeraceae bacterium]|nr:hypothetical protein [Isosphaeraceae bacterium]
MNRPSASAALIFPRPPSFPDSLYLSWTHRFHNLPGFEKVDVMDATAELRPPGRAQTDEADLMPFPVLDQLMYAFVQLGLDPADIFRRLWPSFRGRYDYDDDPAEFAAPSAPRSIGLS